MIVCSCNVICDRRIQRAIDGLIESQPDTLLTPGKVYRELGCTPSCGTCLTQISKMIHAEPTNSKESGDPEVTALQNEASTNQALKKRAPTRHRRKSADTRQLVQASL